MTNKGDYRNILLLSFPKGICVCFCHLLLFVFLSLQRAFMGEDFGTAIPSHH